MQIFYNCLINIKGLRRNEILSAAIDTLDELVDVIGGESQPSDFTMVTRDERNNDPRIGAFKIAAALVLKELNALSPPIA